MIYFCFISDHVQLSCHACDFTTLSKNELKLHQVEHHQAPKKQKKDIHHAQRCDYCNTEFISNEHLKDHLVQNHWSVLNQCGLCGDRFLKAQDLGVHCRLGNCKPRGIQQQSKAQDQLKCAECHFQTDQLNKLLYHQAVRHHEQNEVDLYKCHLCSKSLKKSRLLSHMSIHGDAHRCNQCYRIFSTLQKLTAHMKKSHQKANLGKSEILHCTKCSYTTTKDRLLTLHNKRTHFMPTNCENCGELISSYKKLMRHLNEHQLRFFHCDFHGCPYKSVSRSDLQSHKKSHSKEQPLKCANCEFACKRKSELNRHVKNKHLNTEQFFVCKECENYKTQSRQHLKRHQEICKLDGVRKTYKCRLCKYQCQSDEGIRKHILKTQKHAGEKVYQCHEDNFESDSASDFAFHLNESHGKSLSDSKLYVKRYFVTN